MTNPARDIPLVTCRECGMKHQQIVCPICKTDTPHYAVIKGSKPVAPSTTEKE